MHFQQIEIDEPRIQEHIVRLILGVITVRKARVETMVRPLGIGRASPRLLLEKEDFPVGIEDAHESSGAGNAFVVVCARPRGDGRVNVAIGA